MRHLELLRAELQNRQQQNPRYSLRAFAKYISLHPSALSRILQAKQMISVRASVRIVAILQLPREEAEIFIESIFEERKRKTLEEIRKRWQSGPR